jgi:hypothetical protein
MDIWQQMLDRLKGLEGLSRQQKAQLRGLLADKSKDFLQRLLVEPEEDLLETLATFLPGSVPWWVLAAAWCCMQGATQQGCPCWCIGVWRGRPRLQPIACFIGDP